MFKPAILGMAVVSLIGALIMPNAEAKKKSKPKSLPIVNLSMVRELSLSAAGASPTPGAIISGVSGAVKVGKWIYFVSDSQATLFQMDPQDFSVRGTKLGKAEVGVSVPKSQKADLESLAFIPPAEWKPHGALLAFPSGSTDVRETAFIVELSSDGGPAGSRPVSISTLASALRISVSGLNLEGLVIEGKDVTILQRGNEKGSQNGLFKLRTEDVVKGIRTGSWAEAIAGMDFDPLKIGKLDKVKLTLTDGVHTPRGILALAAAESGDSSYDDGNIRGSILVRVKDGKPVLLVKFKPTVKLEAIVLERATNDNFEFLVFDDPDDEKKASRVFRAVVPKSFIP